MLEENWETELRIGNVSNHFQGNSKKVLCVCSGGLLRSPTAACLLSQEPYNYNTRSAGTRAEYALIKVDNVLLSWCDEIVCMEEEHAEVIHSMLKQVLDGEYKPVYILGIPDRFAYKDKLLIDMINSKYAEVTKPLL